MTPTPHSMAETSATQVILSVMPDPSASDTVNLPGAVPLEWWNQFYSFSLFERWYTVASGDPFDTSVLLWTRAAPVSTASGEVPDQSVPVCVSFKIFNNQKLIGRPIDSGEAFTTYDVDFTVKFEATGLQADTKYWYQFADCTNPKTVSPIGATRTLSHPDTPASLVNGGKPLTLAVFSCSQYQSGYFNAYGVAAHNTSADVFIHLGDYVADQSWKAGTANSNDSSTGCSWSPSGACFTDRKMAAVRAYHEWMPIRQVAVDDKLRIWRNFQIGKLLDLTMLDTRQYDRDITDLYYNTDFIETLSATVQNRSIMGAAQEKWFYDTLTQSQSRGATWRIVGQQIVFSQLDELGVFDFDAWDGYRANRERILDHLYTGKISNTLILSGDSHANWVSDLARTYHCLLPLPSSHLIRLSDDADPNDTTTYDPVTGKGGIGVEFAGTAVTSSSPFGTGITPTAADPIEQTLVSANVDLQWSELSYRGFFTLTIDPKNVKATYYAMRNISTANLDSFASAVFNVKAGANKLDRPVAGGSVSAGALKSTASGSVILNSVPSSAVSASAVPSSVVSPSAVPSSVISASAISSSAV
ncbi:hypothetical protein EUX98_g3043 [Antrodiella citrinella]|uniref:PhoD-like phosphatase metallophosphatase domain-containing protein n=1 Tax=Antrodiella citrinella TaxID=2447956 RepID=A0A4S4N5T0_9APHY|nr:hypothetical protein EUX98_g3043 [Antrodiella citrinella]